MDLSLYKFRICALPQTPARQVSWHPTLPIIKLLGVDMTADQIPEFINFWTSRYRLPNLELAKKLEAALLESHRFMKLLFTIDQRWTKGNLPSGTTGGRILYRRRLNDTCEQGQKLWRYLLQLLRHSQRLTLEQSGNKETEGWIDVEVEREFEGEIFFNIFYDNYLFGPPPEGYGIERLFLGFESWNDNCKTWIDAADALSSKAIRETAVGYLNPRRRRRPQSQNTLPVSQRKRPQNSSGASQVCIAEQRTNDISTAVSPPGHAAHVPHLLPVTRAEPPRRIPPRSGYFTRRPGRLGRLIQPIPQQRRATTRRHQNSSGQSLVPSPRHTPTIVEPSSSAALNPRSPSAAGGGSGKVVRQFQS